MFDNIDKIKDAGFVGFIKVEELFKSCSNIPNEPGVYHILNINNHENQFLVYGTGGFFKGKNPNVSVNELTNNWVVDTKVIYIGKATSLKNRLDQYMKFGQGKNIGHYGGRYNWQLQNAKDLLVCWKSIHNNDPSIYESKLICEFKEIYNKRPFANLKDLKNGI